MKQENNKKESNHGSIELDDIPTAKVTRSRRMSVVWFIPLIAALAGSWLVIKVISEKGPEIKISFSSAEGFEVGKTRLRYKDVDVGKVEKIQLDNDLENVIVTVEVSQTMGKHLNENSRFWAVRPRISAKGVSGLSTLISGVYIAMEPGVSLEEDNPDIYIGLEEPPQITSSTEGKSFTLKATKLGSLDIGSPIYFRQIEVGEVVNYKLHTSGKYVDLNVFIHAPYDHLVQINSRFWNSSGFDLSLGSEGIKAHVESLTTLVSGGIVFDTPRSLSSGIPAIEGKEFYLHPDVSSINDATPSLKLEYVLYFEETLRGLNIGAPVDFRGTTVGKILDKETRIDPISLNVQIPVLIELYPERLSLQDDAIDPSEVIESMVRKGLKASLKTGNLLTGQMYVELEFDEKGQPGKIQETGYYAKFPTQPGQFGQVTRSIAKLASKLENMPLDELVNNLNDTILEFKQLVAAPENKQSLKNLESVLAEISRTSQKFGQLADSLAPLSPKLSNALESADQVLSSADQTMKQVSETLASMNTTLSETANSFSEDSTFHYKLRVLLDELTEASRSLDALVDTLQRKPDALIFGK